MSDTTGLDREVYDDEVIAALPVFRSGFDANPTEFRRHFENILRINLWTDDLPEGIDLSGLGEQLSPVLIKVAKGKENPYYSNDWLFVWLSYFDETPVEVLRSALRLFRGDKRLHDENPSVMAELYVRVGKVERAWDCLRRLLQRSRSTLCSENAEMALEILDLLRPKRARKQAPKTNL